MKNPGIVLITLFICLFSAIAKADDILIPFGQNHASPPVWKYKGGGTNLDAIAWKTLGYAEPGWVSGGSALGFGTNNPAKNTAIPENTSAGGGGNPGTPYPTMYFRKVINIPSLAVYGSFQIRTQFDDAIVIWINEAPVYISNIAANPSYATFANGSNTTYNNGAAIFTVSVPASAFVNGDNIIAVEIHQNNASSSDLFFDMELTGIDAPPPPPPGDVIIFPFGQNLGGAPAWKYKGGGTNLDAIAWKTLGYAEPGWVTGNSALGFGTNPPVRNTAIPEDASAGGGGVSGARYPTMYFRKVVNIADPSAFAAFKISTKYDDGIVVWVNGAVAYRNNINASPAYADLAPAAIANNGADIYNITVATGMFNAGNNIIAVEVHQNTLGSTDLFFDMELTGLATLNAALTRGPYLQVGNETAITLRWRTDVATDSRVTWGTAFGTYPNAVDSTDLTTEHIVRISGLTPDTKYYYTIGSSTQVIQSASSNYFLTVPPANTTRKLRFAGFGDCGTNSTNQVDTKNALLSYIGSNDLDGILLMGDNAYSTGTDGEYQSGFFDVYRNDVLKNKKLYPSPGNHDYGNNPANTGRTGSTPALSMPYHLNFSVPSAGECGGVASGSKAFYSYNIGDVHFVSLDSYGQENSNTTKMYDTLGAQAVWLKNDLAANTKKWTVVYFHHPPYTKTSHDSDPAAGEMDLVAIRERFIRILERYGVDIVLCGHSHGYERSFLLRNYYNTYASPLNEAAFNATTHTATGNTQNGLYNGTAGSCAYTYNSGLNNHGSIYVVAGSAGQIGGQASGYPHNAMYYSNNTNGGSFYFEVDSNRLDAKFISYTGTGGSVTPFLRDSFTIFKDVNKVYNYTVHQNYPLNLSASWRGKYFWPNNGNASTQSVLLNNAALGTFTYYARDAASGNCLQDVFNITVTATLPVSLVDFNATLDNNKVKLNWSTVQEQNNKYFTVERSVNGTQFNFLGTINGAVNSSTVKNYQLTDFAPVTGDNYYRLSQTNTDGQTNYFATKYILYKASKNFTASVVNTSNQSINVIINSSKKDQVGLRVVDILGKEILHEDLTVNAGATIKSLQLQKGVYVLVLSNSKGETISNKIIVN